MARHERLAPQEPGLAAALIALDHFKRIDDVYGHAADDQVLRQHNRRNDMAGRHALQHHDPG